MNGQSSSSTAALSAFREPDNFLREKIEAVQADLSRCVNEATSYAREQPEKALLTAVATGYVLRMLPVVGMVSLLMRFAWALIRPVMLLYSVAKVLEKTGGLERLAGGPAPESGDSDGQPPRRQRRSASK